ncbi:hypothetical protein BDN72DRAFT_896809 [Pluteus cervinus]|uniref:Uncharacterized protein n=1 Tax=Pluteus cervinus TaxID=181527 RepID=A0ACD3AWN7_9AGAR|nr:hypothetical protein BDN72DRAFT_896809 [Pluteus cervinus]
MSAPTPSSTFLPIIPYSSSEPYTGHPTAGPDPYFPAAIVEIQNAPLDPPILVFDTNLFLLSAIAFFTLCKLPRLIARLRTPSEWLNGNLMFSVNPKSSKTRVVRMQSHRSTKSKGGASSHGHHRQQSHRQQGTDDSHTLVAHGQFPVQRLNENNRPVVPHYPPHIPAWPRIFRFSQKWLTMRLDPGLSVGQIIVMIAWFCVLLYPSFFQSSPFTDPVRTGWVAISQFPFVFAFSAKNGILGLALGCGYEKLNAMHRYVGRVVVVATNIHAIGYFYKWSLQGIFMRMLARKITTWGLIGLLFLDLLFLFSLPWWRNRAYNVFLTTHILSFVLVLPAVYIHMPRTLPYVLTCAGICGIDYVCRFLKTRIQVARIRALPDLAATRIEIRGLNSGWRAGQHVRIRVLSTEVTGKFGWLEVHPFTIASVGNGSHEGMVLICKKTGTWTKGLYNYASGKNANGTAPPPSHRLEQGRKHGLERKVKVMIEGPYGGPGHTIFSSFSAAVFVCGGSGITFALGVIQDLVQKDRDAKSRIKCLELIWVLPDPSAITSVIPSLLALIEESAFTPFNVSIYYTRAIPHASFSSRTQPATQQQHIKGPSLTTPIPSPSHSPLTPTTTPAAPPFNPLTFHPHPQLSLQPGRPNLLESFNNLISKTVRYDAEKGDKDKQEEPNMGVVVGVCGPGELGDEVVRVVGELDRERVGRVGGVEVVEE